MSRDAWGVPAQKSGTKMNMNIDGTISQIRDGYKFHLLQLEKFNLSAFAKANQELENGQSKEATETIRLGMQDVLTTLTSPPSQERIEKVIEGKQQWHSGEVVDVWRNGKRSVHIKNERGVLYLLSIVEGKCLMDRQSTQRQVGYLHPALGQWIALQEEV